MSQRTAYYPSSSTTVVLFVNDKTGETHCAVGSSGLFLSRWDCYISITAHTHSHLRASSSVRVTPGLLPVRRNTVHHQRCRVCFSFSRYPLNSFIVKQAICFVCYNKYRFVFRKTASKEAAGPSGTIPSITRKRRGTSTPLV